MSAITITHTHADGTLIEGRWKGDGVYEAGACTAPAEYVLLINGDEDTAERVCGGHLADQLRELLQGRPGEWTVTELNPGAGFACEFGEDGCE